MHSTEGQRWLQEKEGERDRQEGQEGGEEEGEETDRPSKSPCNANDIPVEESETQTGYVC